jgi:hypothetical protein
MDPLWLLQNLSLIPIDMELNRLEAKNKNYYSIGNNSFFYIESSFFI